MRWLHFQWEVEKVDLISIQKEKRMLKWADICFFNFFQFSFFRSIRFAFRLWVSCIDTLEPMWMCLLVTLALADAKLDFCTDSTSAWPVCPRAYSQAKAFRLADQVGEQQQQKLTFWTIRNSAWSHWVRCCLFPNAHVESKPIGIERYSWRWLNKPMVVGRQACVGVWQWQCGTVCD